ncbi:MAG: acyltransferase [Rhodoferax sp.]|nr:acyltransferase [Rhodoferax sp.]
MRSLNEKNYWSRLDHLRLFAAVLVMASHVWHYADGPHLPHTTSVWLAVVPQGHVGVSLFLVLTGYLFTSIVNDNRGEIVYRAFVRNRILRIFPLLTVLFFVLLCVGKEDFNGASVLHLLLLQLNTGDAMSGFGQRHFPVGVWWTTAVELQFYLVFPFIVAFMRRLGVRYLAGLLAVFILIRLGIFCIKGNLYWAEYHSIIGRMDQFLIGMAAAQWHHARRRQVERAAPVLLVGALLLLPVFCATYRDAPWFEAVLSFTVEGFIFAALLLGYQALPVRIPPMLDRVLSRGGELTFSMYLLHPTVLAALMTKFGFFAATPWFSVNVALYLLFVLLPPVFLVSKLTFECIEKPFLSMRVRYFAPQPEAPVNMR